ncbi:Enoyl-CoA hydratase 2, peroxisomal [Zea mays]|uniref:Enoyl-CoA hydratase 2, peroxisomal n=1 Tax=Zea mays TaxID=4577 RepID=A0A3L6FHW5_MAIZE|nr:Enoyl-CoA hydratase 2, peroxisomal [Zea mays]
MESAIKDHPLWANATDQEIDHTLEGLEKYVMTKLFDRTFGTSTEDDVSDMDISEKIGLLQQFVKPHHLDIPKVLHNEASWLALLYMPSGDYNPLHSDPDIAQLAGFTRPILHGLCTLGFAACAVIKSFCNDEPMTVKSIFARLLLHVYPGETLSTEMWLDDQKVHYQTNLVVGEACATNQTCSYRGRFGHMLGHLEIKE